MVKRTTIISLRLESDVEEKMAQINRGNVSAFVNDCIRQRFDSTQKAPLALKELERIRINAANIMSQCTNKTTEIQKAYSYTDDDLATIFQEIRLANVERALLKTSNIDKDLEELKRAIKPYEKI